MNKTLGIIKRDRWGNPVNVTFLIENGTKSYSNTKTILRAELDELYFLIKQQQIEIDKLKKDFRGKCEDCGKATTGYLLCYDCNRTK